MRIKGIVCVPDDVDLNSLILEEGHKICLSIHPGMIKMYQDLKDSFWWSSVKRDVTSCLTCQKAKVERQRLGRMLH